MSQASPQGSSGGSLEPGFSKELRKQFDLMLDEARASNNDSIQLLKRAIAFAQEFQDQRACMIALADLSKVYALKGKFAKAIVVLEEEARICRLAYGKESLRLVQIKKETGICHLNARQLDRAIDVLRESVQLCQRSSLDLSSEMIESLTHLAAVYRLQEKVEQARMCIRQAYELVLDEEGSGDLQAMVLEELAAVTKAQHRFKAAIQAYLRVLNLKQKLHGVQNAGCAETLSALGSCLIETGQLKDAESCFVQSLDILHRLAHVDKALLANVMQKLAGVYHVQGRFQDSTFMEQRISEIVGRSTEMRLGFFKQFDAGLKAQQHKHYDMARDCYYKALRELEGSWGKNALVRIPFLCRLLEIATLFKQKSVRKCLLVEMEEIMLQGQCLGNCNWQRLMHVARLFRLLGHDILADTCYRQAAALLKQPDSRDFDAIAGLLLEHANLLDRMQEKKEAARLRKFVRRSLRLKPRQEAYLPASTSCSGEDQLLLLSCETIELCIEAVSEQEFLVVIDSD